MWENFDLYEAASAIKPGINGPKGITITGYHWPVENAKRVVVLIHGIGEHDGRYDRMAGFFAEEGIALIGMDLRGHGRTGGVRGHAAPRLDVLNDIDTLITYARSVYPGIPLVLYGHSMGGNFVLDYRRRGTLSGNPDAYVISAPWVKLVHSFPKPLVSFVKCLSHIAPQMKFSSACDEDVLGNPDYVRPYSKDPLVHGSITALCAAESWTIADMLYEGSLHGNDDGTKKPTLLMHGTADRICDIEGSRKIASMEPDITFVELEGYFHEIHNGNKVESGEKAIRRAMKFITAMGTVLPDTFFGVNGDGSS